MNSSHISVYSRGQLSACSGRINMEVKPTSASEAQDLSYTGFLPVWVDFNHQLARAKRGSFGNKTDSSGADISLKHTAWAQLVGSFHAPLSRTSAAPVSTGTRSRSAHHRTGSTDLLLFVVLQSLVAPLLIFLSLSFVLYSTSCACHIILVPILPSSDFQANFSLIFRVFA